MSGGFHPISLVPGLEMGAKSRFGLFSKLNSEIECSNSSFKHIIA